MDEIVAALRDQQAELDSYVSGLDEAGLLKPSRCDGWTVADVLLHLAQTNEMAIASVNGELGAASGQAMADMGPVGSVDEWADAYVALERGPALAIRDRW